MDNYTIIKKGIQTEYLSGCPVRVEGYFILSENNTEENFLQLKLKNISGHVLKSVWISVVCYDDADNVVIQANDIPFENIEPKDGDFFGDTNIIALGTKNAAYAKIIIEKTIGADNEVWLNEEHLLGAELPYKNPRSVYGSLYRQFALEMKNLHSRAVTAFAEGDDCWLCPCGQGNAKEDTVCRNCHADREDIVKISSKQYLKAKADEAAGYDIMQADGPVFLARKNADSDIPLPARPEPDLTDEPQVRPPSPENKVYYWQPGAPKRKASLLFMTIVCIAVVFCAHLLYVRIHDDIYYMQKGSYDRAYSIANAERKPEIVKEGVIAYAAKSIPGELKHPDSFSLRNAWFDGDTIVLQAAGKSLDGSIITNFWYYWYNEETQDYDEHAVVVDLEDETVYPRDDADERQRKENSNLVRAAIIAIIEQPGTGLSDTGVQRINHLFKNDKLKYVTLIKEGRPKNRR